MHQRLLLSLVTFSLLSACAGTSTPSQPSPQPSASASYRAQATIAVGKAPHGMAAAEGFVYNSNSAETTVSVIDAATDKVVRTLTLPTGMPSYIKASHSGKYLVVLSPDAGKAYVYAPGQNQALVQTIDVGAGPDRIQFSDDDSKAWVSLAGEDFVTELSFTQGLDQAPQLRKLPTGRNNHSDEHRLLAKGLNWLAVPNSADNNVSLILPEKPAGEQNVVFQAGNQPNVVGIGSWDNQDRMLIIGNTASNTVTLQNLDTGKAMTLSEVGQTPTDIAVDNASGRAFITMAGTNEVAAIDFRNQKLLGKIPTGSRPVHIYLAPAAMHAQHETGGSELWVGNDAGASVTVFDAQSLQVKATVGVGKGHHKMAFTDAKAYVSNITDGSVSVIDRSAF